MKPKSCVFIVWCCLNFLSRVNMYQFINTKANPTCLYACHLSTLIYIKINSSNEWHDHLLLITGNVFSAFM